MNRRPRRVREIARRDTPQTVSLLLPPMHDNEGMDYFGARDLLPSNDMLRLGCFQFGIIHSAI